MPGKRILGAALAPCVHVTGLLNFLRLARECGHETEFLGAAVSVPEIVRAAQEYAPDMLAVGYRLTPAPARAILAELRDALCEAGLAGLEMAFGGTPPVAAIARESGLFAAVFSGEEDPSEVVAFLRGARGETPAAIHPQTLLERIESRAPYPILRHHFGLPSLAETIHGAEELARAEVLDVISIGPDQNAQESFFRAAEMDPRRDGAGGVPLRREGDLAAIYEATRRGNFPMLRIYAGTRDLLRWAELAQRTLKNAWAAVPLFWYSRLDGRSSRTLVEAIDENRRTIAWHAERGLPVEVNDPHQWSLRDAPDVIAVAAAYLSAYNAKALGVETYVAQFMWNTPPAMTPSMDLAKMLATLDLIRTLEGPAFRIVRECRAGLASLSPDPAVAKGQLAASTMLSMALKPQIIHVVAYCEADHAATPPEIIESCRIVRGVLKNTLFGSPDYTLDETVQRRRRELVKEAEVLLSALWDLGKGVKDPLADPPTLARAVRLGLLDAPHLAGNPEGRGAIRTRIVNGACRAVDEQGEPQSEKQRLKRLGEASAAGFKRGS
ncbi:MAG: cobalamin B12-binding domain-containing protein [Bacteroidota bacterium]